MRPLLPLLVTCVVIVAAPMALRSQQVSGLGLELVGRIDPETGDAGSPAFQRIVAVEIGADGTVYVLDALNRSVSVWGPDGRFLRAFGQRGGGPARWRIRSLCSGDRPGTSGSRMAGWRVSPSSPRTGRSRAAGVWRSRARTVLHGSASHRRVG